ncbi:MAG: YeiH family putative sulfate export transporter [Francisellaceae bacterium]|nr:YeiH family putative sulfate export transporter [Francisellaceae bacterium]MBT6207276.1 YeiH family putative sulfate export transporter [Francisellaceae bacterium]MBT6539639.1 YeiH family putative sulfate export transporter [Francisellaceae bacterium]
MLVKLEFIVGFLLVLIISASSYFISDNGILKTFGVSSLISGVITGIFYGNSFKVLFPNLFKSSIDFCCKRILRLAIILYGFNITYQEIVNVGANAVSTSVIMLTTTFLLVLFLGIKVFKIDKELTLLIAAGASVCGAAAVLAMESQLKSPPHKTSIAIITVVLFGTISMFLYPLLMNSEILPLSPSEYGVYVGSSIHEVAQVIIATNAVDGASNNAVIVKMTRVLMLPVLLILVGLSCKNKSSKLVIPWFALAFLTVGIFNSFNLVNPEIVDKIKFFDKALLTIAMTALGMSTNLMNVVSAGLKPIALATTTFIWLLFGGLAVNIAMIHVF